MIFKLSIIFLLIANSFASINATLCGSPSDPVSLVSFSYAPPDSFVIDSLFNYTIVMNVKSGNTIPSGSMFSAKVWYQNFSGDPIFTTDYDPCGNLFNCPLSAGTYTLKDTKIPIPEFPLGEYKVELIFHSPDQTRLACYDIEFSVSNGSTPITNCIYTSSYSFATTVAQGQAYYENSAPGDRKIGDWMQIGNMSFHGDFPLISFSKLDSTADNTFGTTLTPSNFQWALNATLASDDSNSNEYIFEYSGDFWMGSLQLGMTTWDNFFMKGTVEFTETYSKSSGQITGAYGQLNVIPVTSYPNKWAGPISFGKVNPASIQFDTNYRSVVISASKDFCQCEVDICGVCGGDGSSCQSPTSKSESTSKVGVIVPAVVVPIVVVGAIIFVVIYHKKRKQKQLRDSVMNPNIPSYNTSDWTKIGDIN